MAPDAQAGPEVLPRPSPLWETWVEGETQPWGAGRVLRGTWGPQGES